MPLPRRVRIAPLPPPYPKAETLVNNKGSKTWDNDYELVVSYFRCGLDEEVISKIAGLKNCDTGTTLIGPNAGTRDLMFPCGTNKELAHEAAQRLWAADYFGALRLRISYPVEHEGKDSFTPWYDRNGKLIERVKHRRKAPLVLIKKVAKSKRHHTRKTKSSAVKSLR